MEHTKSKIGYILAKELNGSIYIGGLLVTDEKGLPLEFRYTDPISPTKLQRIIYGNALNRYLIVEVIAKSLIDSITDKPDIFITDSRLILELNKLFGAPLISIQESDESPFPEIGHVSKLPNGDILMQIHPSGSPAHIIYAGEPGGFERVQPLLTHAGGGMDLLEPLKRIEEALTEILQGHDKRG
jgi:hypothetical protein